MALRRCADQPLKLLKLVWGRWLILSKIEATLFHRRGRHCPGYARPIRLPVVGNSVTSPDPDRPSSPSKITRCVANSIPFF